MNASILAEVGRAAREHPRTARSANAARRRRRSGASSTRSPARTPMPASVASGARRARRDRSARSPTSSKRRAEAERRADYLRHVVREIGDAKLVDGEDARLEDEARRLENADELRALAGGLAVDARRRRGRGAPASWVRSRSSLSSIQRIDPTLSRLQEIVRHGLLRDRSAGPRAEEYEATIDLDPSRLEEVGGAAICCFA